MILVTGGAGVMGSRLVKRLLVKGKRVRVLTLPGDPARENLRDVGCEIVEGDVARAETLNGICDGVETVYHLAAVIITSDPEAYRRVNVEGTRNMVSEAINSGVSHFIYVSSAAVLDPQSSDYARSKEDAEELLKLQNSFHYTIVRPTLVYDTGGGQEFMLFWDSLQKFPVIPFVGSGKAMKNPVFAEDVVMGLAEITDNVKTHGKIYDFSGGRSLTMIELARLMMKHQGRDKRIICIPVGICRVIAAICEAIMENPPLTRYSISRIEAEANPDNSEARHDLNYNPIAVEEGLQRCYPLPEK